MTSIPRLHIDAPLAEGAPVDAMPGQGHYLGQVMRRGAGDPVALFNGRDGEWAARIESVRKDKAVFIPERQTRPQSASPALRLVVAAVKRDAMDWIMEKATELGVAQIHPVFTARTIAGRVNNTRLDAIAREAAEQCERLDLPVIAEAQPLHALLDSWDGAPLLIGAAREMAPDMAKAATGLRPPLGWLVGPEGGFTEAELDDLRRRPFVRSAGLGPRILRAETAAVAGLAVLQSLCGDWPH